MTVSELKDLLEKHSIEDLRYIVTELYKAVPKKTREEKDLDAVVKDPVTFRTRGRERGKKQETIDFPRLRQEIDTFVAHAYEYAYVMPNRSVPKNERSKWRFLVKGFVRELQSIPSGGERGQVVAEYLEKLYKVLRDGCTYTMFSTDDPFRSVGTGQADFLSMVLTRNFAGGVTRELVRGAIEVIIDGYVDRQTLFSDLLLVLIENLKTPDAKEMAIELSITRLDMLERGGVESGKRPASRDEYTRTQKVNLLVELIFRLNMSLYAYGEGITWYKDRYRERSPEVKVYILLELLSEYRLKDHWIHEYEEAVYSGIPLRQALRDTRRYIEEKGELPERFR